MSKLNYKLLITYVISACLIIFYFFVLYLGMHPRVSKEYTMFYIDHTLKVKAKEGSLLVKPGERLYLDGKEDNETTFTGIGQGWGWEYTGKGVENTGFCYTTQKENFLFFEGVTRENHSLRIHTAKDNSIKAEVEIFVNGVSAGVYETEPESEVTVTILAENILEDGSLEVKVCPMQEDTSIYVDSLIFD